MIRLCQVLFGPFENPAGGDLAGRIRFAADIGFTGWRMKHRMADGKTGEPAPMNACREDVKLQAFALPSPENRGDVSGARFSLDTRRECGRIPSQNVRHPALRSTKQD